MTFNRSIPQPTDLISNSQPILLSNNQILDSGSTQTGTGFSRNHVTMTDGTNGGLHNRIDFYQNIATPSVSGFVASLYPLNVSSASELAYTNAGGTTQITSGSLAIWKGGTGTGVVTITLASTGTMTLPNGLIMKWGKSTSSSSSQTISFATPFPNNLFNVQITQTTSGSSASSAGAVVYTSGFSQSGFKFITSSGSINGFFWFAIGN